ncbi:MAG: antirestriction protein ArdA [Oscillospiraceae bacterium]
MFEVHLSKPGWEAGAALKLPATDAELLDALERARIVNERDIYSVTVYQCEKDYLPQVIPVSANLFELNLLAKRLTELDDWQQDCFEGLVARDSVETGCEPIRLERLINMTYSTDDCQIAYKVRDDRALGAFYLENGFYDDRLTGLSEEMIEMLDTKKLGQRSRSDEGGVFTRGGYVIPGDIRQVYSSGNTPYPQKPDYVFALDIAKLPEADEKNAQRGVTLRLPATEEEINAAFEELGTDDIEGCCFLRYESAIPQLLEAFGFLEDFHELNELAKTVAALEHEDVRKFKAVLEAADCGSVQQAALIAVRLDEYNLLYGAAGTQDAAALHLQKLLPRDEFEALCPHVNMYAYAHERLGEEMRLTSYGLLSRYDGGQLIAPKPEEPGMNMY